MELTLLDENFVDIAILDVFESLIWTDKYDGYGDFELTTYATNKMVSALALKRYLTLAESEHMMIIEDVWIKSDEQNGNSITAKGRSIESILDRRIVWKQTNLSGNVVAVIGQLLDENVISPEDPDRAIPNFIYVESEDPAILAMELDTQLLGDNLYKVIENICVSFSIGFKLTKNDDNQLVFELYNGKDRSYDQLENPYVVFSPEFDDIVNSEYSTTITNFKNMVLVAGEGEGSARTRIEVGAGEGLDRREIFADARDISKTTDEGPLDDNSYAALLAQRGFETLAKNTIQTAFEGQVDATKMFLFGVDFFMGDIVQVANEYGHEGQARVVELIRSQDSSGLKMFPKFKTNP